MVRPLLWAGLHILSRFQVTRTLAIEESVLQNWLNLMEANYLASNSYHNSTHAADVLQVEKMSHQRFYFIESILSIVLDDF